MSDQKPSEASQASPATMLHLRVDDLRVWFGPKRSRRKGAATIKAVDGLSFAVERGSTMAIVGESGSGKTTVARVISGVLAADEGHVYLDGVELTGMRRDERRAARGEVQMIFQDPHGSLNPRRRIGPILVEVLRAHGATRAAARNRTIELLEQVGLGPRFAGLLPHELSGGQRQRVGIARALATNPSLIVCDEPLSALDVSIQAQVLTLLAELQRTQGITYIFISHDLAVVRALAVSVAVMYQGRIVEIGPADTVLASPAHPYTALLLSAVPEIDADAQSVKLGGRTRSAADDATDESVLGCPFVSRCWLYTELDEPERCHSKVPAPARASGSETSAACHFADRTSELFETIKSGRRDRGSDS